MAKVPKQKGGLWHPYRRKWRNARKHLPDTDVAAVGGWTDTRVMEECYADPDPDTMLEVVDGGKDLREKSE